MEQNEQSDQLRAFLTDPDRRDIVSITAIERKAGIPATSLMKFINGTRSLPDVHQLAVANVLKAIGYVTTTNA